jgi:hypothetical protein
MPAADGSDRPADELPKVARAAPCGSLQWLLHKLDCHVVVWALPEVTAGLDLLFY